MYIKKETLNSVIIGGSKQMTKEKLLEKIMERFDEMYDDDLVCIHNEYCQAACMYDDELYSMELFDELFMDKTPSDIAYMIQETDFRINDDYFWFNGYGHIESGDVWDAPIDTDDIATYIMDNLDGLYDYGMENIIEEYENDEEEE